MKFTQEFIEKVQESSNLVDIISQYTQLKHSGSGFMGRCPFPDHQEKTASFSVSEPKQVYHCFGCHKSGNIFTFLRDYNGMAFPQAIEFLADRAGIIVPKDESNSAQEDLVHSKKKELLKINKEALAFFKESLVRLPQNHYVRDYLKKRQISEEIIQAFKIGFAPPEWNNLCDHLVRKNFSLSLAEEAKLVKTKNQGDGKFDLFRDRLMFPITNSMGDVLAFGGRIFQTGEPKYLNSPETLVFQKGKIFYGLEQTAKYVRSEDQIIIVEGYMDLISLYKVGIRNVVATMGTALTTDHCRVIKKITQNVIVLFDGDNAGKDAAQRALSILLEQDLYPKGIFLPNGLDPDDYIIQYGLESLKHLIDHSIDLMNLIFKEWLVGFKGEPSEKLQMGNKVKSVLELIPNPRFRELYIQQLAPLMGVETKWLQQLVSPNAATENQRSPNKSFSGNSNAAKTHSRRDSLTNSVPNKVDKTQEASIVSPIKDDIIYRIKKAPKPELLMLSLVIKSYANVKQFDELNVMEYVTHGDLKKLFTEVLEVYRQSPEKFDRLTSLLISKVDSPDLLFFSDPTMKLDDSAKFVAEDESGNKNHSENSRELTSDFLENQKANELKLFKDVMKRVKENSLKEKLKAISHELKLGATSEKMEKMIQIQNALKELKQN